MNGHWHFCDCDDCDSLREQASAALDEVLARGIPQDEPTPLTRRDLAAAIATYALVVVGIPAVFILAAVLHGWRFH